MKTQLFKRKFHQSVLFLGAILTLVSSGCGSKQREPRVLAPPPLARYELLQKLVNDGLLITMEVTRDQTDPNKNEGTVQTKIQTTDNCTMELSASTVAYCCKDMRRAFIRKKVLTTLQTPSGCMESRMTEWQKNQVTSPSEFASILPGGRPEDHYHFTHISHDELRLNPLRKDPNGPAGWSFDENTSLFLTLESSFPHFIGGGADGVNVINDIYGVWKLVRVQLPFDS